MIISHRHEFIYVKTKKTGGTSLEIALSKFLGGDDIVTPITRKDEAIRSSKGFPGPRNYRKSMTECSSRDIVNALRHGRMPNKYYNHIPSAEIKNLIKDDIWSKYYKFTVERNPWDLAVSYYFMTGHRKFGTFDEYIEQGGAIRASNFDLYCINGIPAVDKIIRYENLSDELDTLTQRLGLPESISTVMEGIRAKGQFRKIRNYRDLYDDRLQDVVAVQFAREIAMFGFTF